MGDARAAAASHRPSEPLASAGRASEGLSSSEAAARPRWLPRRPPIASLFGHALPTIAGLAVAVLAIPAVILVDAVDKRAQAGPCRMINAMMARQFTMPIARSRRV